MKRLIFLLSAALCVAAVFASVADLEPTQASQAFRVTAKASNHIDIRFELPAWDTEFVEAGGSSFQRIVLPGAGTTLDSGLPELPTLSMNLAIPRQGGVRLSVLGQEQSLVSEFLAYPVQQSLEGESPKHFAINQDFYTTGTQYPSELVQHSDPMILRDFRIVNVVVNPFSYNPQNKTLQVNQQIDLRITYTNEPGINEMEGELLSVSPSFAKVYEAMILNFDDYRYLMFSNQPPRYLIIHGNSTDPAFLTALNEFVLWKKQKGADVDLASTASSEAGTSTSSIKNYIQTAYNNPATRPDFVILLGDTTGSYAIPAFTVSGGGGDYPYTHLAGNDILGDCFIGRISVENLAQLQNLFSKIYLYERDINLSTAQWLDRMLLVGDTSPSGISTMYISKYIKERGLYVNPNYTFTEIYNADPSTSQINAAINQGVGFYSYRGYIDFAPPAESALTNLYRMPHCVNITCGSNNYWNGTSEMEQFVRYGTPAMPKGAITGIGMSTSSTHTGFNNVLHGGIFGGILQHGMRTMGEALLCGRLYMSSIYGVTAPGYTNDFTHWCNLIGDPTVEVFTGIPQSFEVETLDSIPLGLSLMDMHIINANGEPVENASVTLSQGASIISRGYTDEGGNLILTLPQSMTVNPCVLTISKHDFKPLQQTIQMDDSGTLVPGSIIVDDDSVGASNGNNDGLAQGGETLEILFGLVNTSSEAIFGLSGMVQTDNPWVTFLDSLVVYSQIEPSQMGFNTNPVVMHIAPDAPHGAMIRLHVLLTDDQGNEYDVSEFIPIHNAKMIYIGNLVTNGGNQVLDPGETAGFTVTVANITPNGISEVWGKLYSHNDLVSVTDNIAWYGDLLQNVQVTPSDNMFELYGRPMLLPGMVIPMSLKLYNDAGFEQWLGFSLTVGVVSQSDPLGPDAYGYVIYDDHDYGYEECPVYDWVGIAPAEGGSGTLLPITDAWASNNEGDQVGANSLAVVDLPFPFQFYGLLYDQITVCSNGFIAMGVTENAEFRNYRLPGPMGPNPMIAPFWDDLTTHNGGGIYTWFDRNNHAFVVEWYNMKNGCNGTSPETFQVILYDQSMYPSSMGDGPIKIQYHTFNNVDATTDTRKHGNYCTIGIEDHSGEVGLEYSYSNTWPTAASPLGNGRAIYITNIPIYHYEPHVILGETYINDQNGNGVCEPGETVELGIQLRNIGNQTAEDITATLSTANNYVSISKPTAVYYSLEGDAAGVNRTPFEFYVSPDCPNETVVNFVLTVESGETIWERNFSLRVEASVLTYESFLINDADGEFNGIIDLLETVKLVVNVKNQADVESRDIQATLSTSSADVVIADPIIVLPIIEPKAIMQFVFELQFVGVGSQGGYIPFQFNVSLSNGNPLNSNLMIPYNMPNIFNDFETNSGGFVSETGWVWGTPSQVSPYSGTKLWATGLSGNYPDLVSYSLITPAYTLSQGSVLSLQHRYGFEANYDGGNVSISTNDGASWTVIAPLGGYTHSSLSGLGGEPGFSGSIANWQPMQFNLSQYSGQRVRFRFRMGSDTSVNGIGWFIDDFELSGVDQKTGYLHGTVIPISETPPSETLVMANNNYSTHPDENGYYRLYLPFGTFNTTASLLHHQSSSVNNIPITPANPIHQTDFTLISLPEPENPAFTVDNDTGTVVLFWSEPSDPVLSVMNYRVYKKFDTGPFELIQTTTGFSHTDHISLDGNYAYYICAVYLNNEGRPSQTMAFEFPYVDNTDETIPGLVTSLKGNYPNPFNPSTTIAFELATGGATKLRVYNVRGQLIKTLANGELNPGSHRAVWDGRDEGGREVSSGVYFYRLEAPGYLSTRKMLMLK
ncbi:MAG: T9SS type A sorting domain-containing protein [Candidatus Cloacimonetes bacterium]|jgi:hypothetical protein|nr:T9SS type A sorting domain-containing protein [Candidatus Cloacimonadota bacterium]